MCFITFIPFWIIVVVEYIYLSKVLHMGTVGWGVRSDEVVVVGCGVGRSVVDTMVGSVVGDVSNKKNVFWKISWLIIRRIH